MRDLLDQIERSLDAELFYLSLLACTAVPDIAAALEARDGLANGRRYAAWFDHWIRPRFGDIEYPYIKGVMEWFLGPRPHNPMTGEAFYRFRCSLLHQGRARSSKGFFRDRGLGIPHQHPLFSRPQVVQFVFLEPPNAFHVHYEQIDSVLFIDLLKFCREMVTGTQQWLLQVEATEPYLTNYNNFARRRVDGWPGIPGVRAIG